MDEVGRIEAAKRLKQLRGKTPQQLIADAIGCSKMTISKYERGVIYPDDGNRKALAAYYGLAVEVIFPELERRRA
ncbi:helix-turn-helix transcriptional regulator [Gemmiger sp.]